jgi:hypothetical protein
MEEFPSQPICVRCSVSDPPNPPQPSADAEPPTSLLDLRHRAIIHQTGLPCLFLPPALVLVEQEVRWWFFLRKKKEVCCVICEAPCLYSPPNAL